MRPIATLILADRNLGGSAAERARRVESKVAGARSWPPRPIVVVLGSGAEQVVSGADLDEATVVVNPEWRRGRVTSLRAGFDVLGSDPHLEAAMVVLAEQLDVEARTASALCDAFGKASRLVVPKYRYEYGYPVVVGRLVWDRAVGGTGDLLTVAKAHPEWVEEVWVDVLPPGRRRPVSGPDGDLPAGHWQAGTSSG